MPHFLREQEPPAEQVCKYVREGWKIAWDMYQKDMYHAEIAGLLGLGEDLGRDEYDLPRRRVDDAGLLTLRDGSFYTVKQGSGSCEIRGSNLRKAIVFTCLVIYVSTHRKAVPV